MYLVGRAETAIEFYTNQREYREMRSQGKVSQLTHCYYCVSYCVM